MLHCFTILFFARYTNVKDVPFHINFRSLVVPLRILRGEGTFICSNTRSDQSSTTTLLMYRVSRQVSDSPNGWGRQDGG